MDRCVNLFYNVNKHKQLLRPSRISLTGKTLLAPTDCVLNQKSKPSRSRQSIPNNNWI